MPRRATQPVEALSSLSLSAHLAPVARQESTLDDVLSSSHSGLSGRMNNTDIARQES
jgi:hypothetical protein